MGPMNPAAARRPEPEALTGIRCARLQPLRSKGLFIALTLLAAALRLPTLAARPMHADEAIHADKFGTLLEGGGYAYDPTEYHGPTLYYLTLLPAWLRGESRYVAIDEVTLRSVPAVLGVALVAAHFGLRGALGTAAAAFAAFLAAISPAMVFYSRYYIHEIPLVLFTFRRAARSPAIPAGPGARPGPPGGDLRGSDARDQGDGAARPRLPGAGVGLDAPHGSSRRRRPSVDSRAGRSPATRSRRAWPGYWSRPFSSRRS